jgi:hypothetical protein
MTHEESIARPTGRRQFLLQLSAAAAAASGLVLSARSPAEEPAKKPAAAPMPTIQLGNHRVSRLTRTHSPENMAKVPPLATLEIGYPFYRSDPLTMTEVVRKVKQPCQGFKILAAGRMCASEAAVKQAFKFAFEHIKPTDGVIVGMYPRFVDEIRVNAEYVRELGKVA